MSAEALKRIEENIRQHENGEDAKRLDLSSCGITTLPDLLRKCIWLKELSLDVNVALSDLSPLAQLSELTDLALCQTRVSDLSPLAQLSGLTVLYCYETQVSDLSPLAQLSGLRRLECFLTQVSDLSPLAQLSGLTKLDFSRTRVSDLSPLAQLSGLTELKFNGTPVSDLSPLAQLSGLTELDCSETEVSDLYPLAQLSGLTVLDCSGTQVTDLSPLAQLSGLTALNFWYTQVSDLTPFKKFILGGMRIEWEDVGSNADTNEGANFFACPLLVPPLEIAQDSPEAVREYFKEIDKGSERLNEVKILFLGEASSGKTSLVKRLMGDAFDPKESQTHGIRIQKMSFTLHDGETVAANLWDFGGQEVMHATHQFFLSQRCIYVLLLNSRNDDQAEKWLKHAEAFGGNSPVLVVLNKIDENPSFEVDQKNLREKYPQIQGFHKLSAKTEKGIGEFRQALQTLIEKADTRRTLFPSTWLEVKRRFTEMQEDYIESSQYEKVCRKKGIAKKLTQDVLLQFLHDLGVVINFRNLKHFDTQILNPLWLTNGVYRIINSEKLAQSGGVLRESDFDAVINDPRYTVQNTTERQYDYPVGKLHYIVRVMKEFELCFAIDDRTYVIPQLLPVQGPEFVQEGATIHFVVHFPDFLPDALFPRLMVKMHSVLDGEKRWRTGMVLKNLSFFDAYAEVRWDKETRKISIDVCGEDRRRLLKYIRETIKEIVEGFQKINYVELVPIPGCTETEDYDYLVTAEKEGEKEIFVKALRRRVSIAALLDGIEAPEMRGPAAEIPVKVFISYSHKDADGLQELKTALSPFIRLQKLILWDDRSIDAGADWKIEIFRELAAADLVLCLISADFVASDFCYGKELRLALQAHHKGEKVVVPIRLRSVAWEKLPIGALQGIPGEWITTAANKDVAWTAVAHALEPLVEKIKKKKLNSVANKSPFNPASAP